MMNSLRWRALFVTLVMLAGAAAAVIARPTNYLADQVGKPELETLFPKEFGSWRVDTNSPVILPSPDVQAMLDKIYNQVLSRTYTNAQGERIMLSVAYGGDQSDGTSAHRPEVCYPAQGFAITSNRLANLPIGQSKLPVRQLMSKLGTRSEPITYWIVVGGEVVTSGIQQKIAQMRYGVRGVIADGILIRISNISSNSATSYLLHAEFASDLSSALGPGDHARIFGGRDLK